MATQEEILELAFKITGQRDADALKASLEGLGGAAGKTGGEIDKMVSELDAVVAASKKLEQFATGTAKLAELEDQLLQARNGLKELNQEFDGTGKRAGDVGRAFKAAEKAVADLEKQQAKQVDTLDRLGGELKEAGVDTTKLSAESDRLKKISADTATSLQDKAKALKEAKDQAEASAARWKEFGQQLQTVRDRSNEAAGKIIAVGAAAAAAVASLAAYGTARFFKAGIEDAAEFESALGRIQAAAGLTDDAMLGVKASIESVAAAASRDVADAAVAFEGLAREGLSAEQAVAALKPALDFATASGLETKEAIGALAGVLDQFGLAADETANAADVLAAASLKGGTSVADMAKALEQVGPTARALGVDLESTSAALAVLAQNGIEGGKAGGVLRGVLAELADPASRLQVELQKLGIESSDLGTVLDELSTRGTAAEGAFNALGARGSTALRLLTEKSGELRALTVDLGSVTGAVGTMAATVNRDLNTSFDNVGRAFGDLRRSLVEPLLEPMRLELDALTARLREFAESPEFASIRESLVTIFEAGAKAVREFVGEIDWDAFAARIAAFADGSGDKFREFASSATTAATGLLGVLNAVDVAISGLATGIFSVAAAAAKISQLSGGMILLAHQAELAGLRITGTTEAIRAQELAIRDVEETIGGWGAVYERFAEIAEGSMARVRAGLSSTGDESDKAAQMGGGVGPALAEGLDAALPAIARVADGLGSLQESAAEATPDIANLGVESQTAFERYETGIDSAIGSLESLGDSNRAVTAEIRQQWAAARDDLVARATQIARQIQAELSGLNREDVLARLRAELQQAATLSGRFDTAMARTANQLAETGNAADRAASSISKVAKAAPELTGAIDDTWFAADNASYSLGAMSEAAANLYREINNQVGIGTGWGNYLNAINGVTRAVNEQRAAAQARLAALDAEMAQYDPLSAKLAILKSQYALVDDATLQQIAQREQRLEQERKRAEQELARVEQQQAKLEQQQQQQRGPEKIDFRAELIVKNEQKPGGLISELSERDIALLAQRIIDYIRRSQ